MLRRISSFLHLPRRTREGAQSNNSATSLVSQVDPNPPQTQLSAGSDRIRASSEALENSVAPLHADLRQATSSKPNNAVDGGREDSTKSDIRPVPATVKAFLEIRSDLDLTGKLNGISVVSQSAGGFSDIYSGYCDCGDDAETKVAVKKLRAHIQDNKTFEKDLVKEMYIWSKLNHPRILRFEGFFLEQGAYPLLVSKWMGGGTAMQYVGKNTEPDLIRLSLGIAEGLTYLHTEGVIHSDVKPENVLMSESGDPYLCDFGLSRRLVVSQTLQFSVSAAGNARGSLRFMTKELLLSSDAKPSEASDVWAFGMTILSLLTQMPPYSHLADTQVMIAIFNNELPPCPSNFDSWPVQKQILASGLEYLHYELGPVLRSPIAQNEAHDQARRSISKMLRGMEDLIRRDPGGSFLRIYLDNRVKTNETILAELRNTTPPCLERSNKPVYFASAEYDGSIVPGKFCEEWNIPFRVAYGHGEHGIGVGTVLKFEPDLMELVEISNGAIPGGRIPVIGGKESDGTPLYHAIAVVEGLRIPGKASEHLGGAKIGYGWEHLRPTYELLCWKVRSQ